MTSLTSSLKNSPRLQRMRNLLARRFMQRLKRATHRTSVRLADLKRSRVLMVAPHRDDEVIPCGGTLLRHLDAGSEVAIIFISDSGGISDDPEIRSRLIELRQNETDQVLEQTGMRVLDSLEIPDGTAVQHEVAIREHLRRCIAEFQPDIVLAPSPADNHADHQATAIGLADALGDLDGDFSGEVWAFELWSTIWPNVLVDISQVAERKRALIGCYASQMADRDYASAILGLNCYRGLRAQVDMAEAFFAGSAADYRNATAELDSL